MLIHTLYLLKKVYVYDWKQSMVNRTVKIFKGKYEISLVSEVKSIFKLTITFKVSLMIL